jgi:hypothetical protein
MVVPRVVAMVDPMVVMHQNKTIATAAIALDSSLLIHSPSFLLHSKQGWQQP